VYIKFVADARVPGGDNDRTAVNHEADVTNESLVEDSVDSVMFIVTAFG
jgi:hypothetical protein